MTINDNNSNFKGPQRRYQRHGRSRKSPDQSSSAQAQPASDAQSGSGSGALFDSAGNTSISGGQFTAAANVNRHVTINITEGTTAPTQNENCSSPQATNPSRNRRRGPIRIQRQVAARHVQRSNEIYKRHLEEKQRGHPLWIPQSNMVLPIPYRKQGVRVGDVGLITNNGGFDFLFNICVPRDDPINPEELPENFVPIFPSINAIDIRKFAEFSPGSYLASSSVAESRTAEQSSGLTFESSASEGAILTMPEGAYSEDLGNYSRFEKYIATHAEDWYKFVNGPRGREAQNGDLCVVVGCDKTTSWGMATFANSSSSQNTNFRLKFSTIGEQSSQQNAGNRYTWEHSGVAEVRVGPGRGENEELGETDSNRLRNQCLFMRTLTVTLSEKVWGEMFPATVTIADQHSSHSRIQDQSMPHPHGGGGGHSHSQLSQSNNLPFRSHSFTLGSDSDTTTKFPKKYGTLDDLVLPKVTESYFGKLHRYDIIDGVPPSPSTSLIEGTKEASDSGPCIESFNDMFLEDVPGSPPSTKYVMLDPQLAVEEDTSSQISANTSPNSSRCEEIQCDSMPDVILTRSSPCRNVLRPSKIINQYLLEQTPDARVAVTHDRTWGSVISTDLSYSDPSQFFSVVRSMNDTVFDKDTGLVSLELKEKDQNGILSEEVSRLIGSIKEVKLTLDQYLFGFQGDQCLRLRELCDALRSGQPIPTPSFLTGHPERLMSLDELLNIGNGCAQDSAQRQSIVSLRAELNLPSSQCADQSNCLLRLADALLRRYSQWNQKDDLEEAIWSYEKALSLIPNSHHYYLEALLGLCSSLHQRFYLLGHVEDLDNLLKYLELQYDVLSRWNLLLAPIEAQLKKSHPDSLSNEEWLTSGLHAQDVIKGVQFHLPEGTDAATLEQPSYLYPPAFTMDHGDDMLFVSELNYRRGSSNYGFANEDNSNVISIINDDHSTDYKNFLTPCAGRPRKKYNLDEYLFASKGGRCLRPRQSCDALRSDPTSQPIPNASLLPGHPERSLSFDELFNTCNGDSHAQDSTQRQSVISLRAKLSFLSFPSQRADRSNCLLRLAGALLRRFFQWNKIEDLDEGIQYYGEALSLIPDFRRHYVEALLGLCSSLRQRFCLLGHVDDHNDLLRYLKLQYDALDRGHGAWIPPSLTTCTNGWSLRDGQQVHRIGEATEEVIGEYDKRGIGSVDLDDMGENIPGFVGCENESGGGMYTRTGTFSPEHDRPSPLFKKKALLTGISCSADTTSGERPKGPHADLLNMRQLLIDQYDYNPADITVLIDDDDPDHTKPTKDNLIQSMKDLVVDARSGDRFFFHFAGHGTKKEDEIDGWDSIPTCDDKTIKDDTLKQILVDPLPVGCNLVVVFDTCHSGTLLDLEHQQQKTQLSGDSADNCHTPIRSAPPTPMFCTGRCRERPEDVKPTVDVISISAARDCRFSWGNFSGLSMTKALIKVLSK